MFHWCFVSTLSQTFLLKFLQRTKNRSRWVNSWPAVSECAKQLRSCDEKCLSSHWDLLKLEEIHVRSLRSFSQEKHPRSRRFSAVSICSSSNLGEQILILEHQAFTDCHCCFIVFPQSPKAKTDSTSEAQNKPSAPWEEDAPQRCRTHLYSHYSIY